MESKPSFDRSNPEARLRKCALLGCGRLGASIAYTLMLGAPIGELVLIDPDFRLAEAEALDLMHTLPFRAPMEIYAGDYADLADCGLIILSLPSLPKVSPTAADALLAPLQVMLGNISLYNPHAILLVASEPVEWLCQVILRLSSFPPEHILGVGTVAETARLKQMLGRHLGVDSKNVHAFVIGGHGEDRLPIWSSANISGIGLRHFCESSGRGYDKNSLDMLFRDIRDSAERILRIKQSDHFTVAEAVKRIVCAILQDEHSVLPVSACVQGHYGLEGVCLSLPCLIGRNGIRRVLEIPLDENEEGLLRGFAHRLRQDTDRFLPMESVL